jgi:hypothetical protein
MGEGEESEIEGEFFFKWERGGGEREWEGELKIKKMGEEEGAKRRIKKNARRRMREKENKKIKNKRGKREEGEGE